MNNQTIINLTPHTVSIYLNNGDVLNIPSSGQARAEEQKQQIDIINNIPVYSIKYGNITGLLEPQENTIYIVSQIVASTVPDRNDVYIVSDTVRDSEGKIIGCRALAHV